MLLDTFSSVCKINLCEYVQQGQVMHLVALVCVYVYMWPKINLFSALPFEKHLLCVLYFLIMEFKRLQSGFLHPVSCTDEAICACSI